MPIQDEIKKMEVSVSFRVFQLIKGITSYIMGIFYNIVEQLYFTNIRSILIYVSIILFYCFAIYPTADAGQNKLQTKKLKIYYSGAQPGHYLEWNNKPILLIGDSVTQGWMECGVNFNHNEYVDALASRGINLLMIWSYIATNAHRQQRDSRIGYDAPEIWPWVGSPDIKTFDLTRLNQTYFDRLKALIAYAEKKGIVVLITVHDGWTKRRFDMHPFNAALGNGPLNNKREYVELDDYFSEMPETFNQSWTRKKRNQYFQERFCARLISELNSYSNVIYEIFNEGEWYNRRLRNLHEQHFLSFFRARCNNLLATNSDHISADEPHNDAKVDLISLHGPWIERFSDFQNGFHKTPAKPYLLSEPVPASNTDVPRFDSLRRMVWEVAIAGGNCVNQNDLSFGWDRHSRMTDKSFSRDRVYGYVGYSAKLFNNSEINFSDMSPRGDLSSTGICMAREAKEYVVYSAGRSDFTLDLSKTQGLLNVRWYNPRVGTFAHQTTIRAGEIIPFASPDRNDWVLHIKSSTK